MTFAWWLIDASTLTQSRAERFASAGTFVAIGGGLGLLYALVLWLPGWVLAESNGGRDAPGHRPASRSVMFVPVFAVTLLAVLATRQMRVALSAHDSIRLPASVALGAVAIVTLATAIRLLLEPRRRYVGRARYVPAGAFVVGMTYLFVDRTLGSFEATGAFVPCMAHLCSSIGLTLGLRASAGSSVALHPRARSRRDVGRSFGRIAIVTASVATLAWCGVFASSRELRRSFHELVPMRWDEPSYATRSVRWLALLDSASDRAHLLERKYPARAPDPWSARRRHREIAAPAATERLTTSDVRVGERDLATSSSDWNVIVVFVDALRADVAADRNVMPETARFFRESTTFTRAYASGSSTLLTLAPLLTCRYDATTEDSPLLLDLAHHEGMKTALVTAKSAREYHRLLYPRFRFDHEDAVSDSGIKRVATAAEVTRRSLAWLREEKPERFFLWLYHHDVHSWADIDETYVEQTAKRARLSTTALPLRYLAAAHGVDTSFGELRAGLRELGIEDRTVIVFISDHGEGLGEQQNFLFHSTFLWESLIRVPLAIHVPGGEAAVRTAPVSTIDVPTTLSSFLGARPRAEECHGEDLLGAGTAQGSSRRHPIQFAAMIEGRLVRVGMLDGSASGAGDAIDGEGAHKIVVDLRDAEAHLLRVGHARFDEEDISASRPDLLSAAVERLLGAAIFPKP